MLTHRSRGSRTLLLLGATLGLSAALQGIALGGLDKGALPTAGFSYTSVVDNGVDIHGDSGAAASPAPASPAVGAGMEFTTNGPMAVKTTFTSAPVDAGADLGWHYHNGFVIVTVTNGTLTLFDDTCAPIVVAAGHSYIESPGQVLDAKALPDSNPGGSTVDWFTTRLYPDGSGDPVEVDPPCTP